MTQTPTQSYYIQKRDGSLESFDIQPIREAIQIAVDKTIYSFTSKPTPAKIEKCLVAINQSLDSLYTATTNNIISIYQLQDIVEMNLLTNLNVEVGKAYILYRNSKDKERVLKLEDTTNTNQTSSLLSKSFINNFKHLDPPMTNMGMFVYSRTYSRYIESLGRREEWWETVKRAVDYNMSLDPKATPEEAEELFDNIFNLRQFLSGRTLWMGGTEVSNKYPMANYNCSFKIIDSYESFSEIFYLLMVGAGVGFRIKKDDVGQLPYIRKDINLVFDPYKALPKANRQELTTLMLSQDGSTARIYVGDSKEGWVNSMEQYFNILKSNMYQKVNTIIINLDSIRPKGEKLKLFGGTASGHNSLQEMYTKIHKVIQAISANPIRPQQATNWVKPRRIDCLDIANIIGENVVSGGVRRTSEIAIIEVDDEECLSAKQDLYKLDSNGKWVINQDLLHRQMSNNSIMFEKKPDRQTLHSILQKIKTTGEPGFINAELGRKKRKNFNGLNPCGEILLGDRGLCNLTTVNVMAFVEYIPEANNTQTKTTTTPTPTAKLTTKPTTQPTNQSKTDDQISQIEFNLKEISPSSTEEAFIDSLLEKCSKKPELDFISRIIDANSRYLTSIFTVTNHLSAPERFNFLEHEAYVQIAISRLNDYYAKDGRFIVYDVLSIDNNSLQFEISHDLAVPVSRPIRALSRSLRRVLTNNKIEMKKYVYISTRDRKSKKPTTAFLVPKYKK